MSDIFQTPEDLVVKGVDSAGDIQDIAVDTEGNLLFQGESASSATLSSAIALNASTSTTVAAANTERLFIAIFNSSTSEDIWIKLQAASVDNDAKGIFVGGEGLYVITSPYLYTGEISAISDSGTPSVYVTEY